MTSQHRHTISGEPGVRAIAVTWSPRNRLFFLIGSVVVSWGVVILLLFAWA